MIVNQQLIYQWQRGAFEFGVHVFVDSFLTVSYNLASRLLQREKRLKVKPVQISH
jgi:hypothetical protein